MISSSFSTNRTYIQSPPHFLGTDTKNVHESSTPSSSQNTSSGQLLSGSVNQPFRSETGSNIRLWLFDLQKQKEAEEEHAALAPCRYDPSRHRLSENDQILVYRHPDGTTFKVAGKPCTENLSGNTCLIKNWGTGDASILLHKILDEKGNSLWMLRKHIGIRGGAGTSTQPTPRIDVADRFSVRQLPKNIELSYEADEEKHYLYAYVDKKNQLGFSIRAQGDRETYGSGRDMFISLMKRLEEERITVDRIQAHWATNDDSVNTKSYLENLDHGMSRQDAANNTWTGRILGEYGFRPQTFRTSEDKTSIYVIFKK
ncbi:MAG TPA: hypothetical protein VF427_05380 [Noviherbaspirillum sp.]